MIEFAEIVAGWPFAASMVAAIAVQNLRTGRRRSALNEAMHELRRPLQAIALASGARGSGSFPVVESSVRLAAAALERLDHEVNGGALQRPAEVVEMRPTLESAVRRWRARASLGGGSLSLRWRAGRALVVGDRVELAQALDNLIVNAIEHGGPAISVDARLYKGRLRIVIADSGRASRPAARRDTPAEVITRLSGHSRRGHGLIVVRQVAADHDGRFALRRSDRGSLALFELPLKGDRDPLAA
ncbi:MAG TPA: HAMP domain-containing sensor histidine kinase [Solirubrobacterales bacterium]|nr:HAMP domain-containing sensor histidine kinase [Solirubrobacterales bacterium]